MVLQSNFIEIKNHSLFIDDVNALDLAKQYGTPLYVMSEGHIRHQMNILKERFMDKYDNTLPLFASKSFSCLEIYKIASEYGIGIDCVSAGEISIALKAGFDPDKIYFHGNNKLPSEIKYALENKVYHFVIDNFYEIELVEKIAKELNVMVKATIRVTPGVYAGGHDYIRVGAKDTKFGFSSHDQTYLKAIGKVIEAEHIDFEGIHCHVGSQIEEIQAYVLAMQKFVEIAYNIYEKYGIVIKKLNAGGGFGIQYTEQDQPLDFDLVVKTIVNIINTGFEAKGWKRPMIMIEPGRFVVGNAGVTLYTAGSIKDIPRIRKYISVDGGMNENIRPALYQSQYDAINISKVDDEKDTKVTIAGKNCESGDILIKDIMMANPESGDILGLFSTGAYHYTMSSNYNQIPKSAVVFTYQGKSKLVIRRQTFEDLVYYDTENEYE
jgi:diaminopimelate decarboxylase